MNNYYVYRIINKLNNKLYIGIRKHANPLSDKYMGSGKYISLAIAKYGILNFVKLIIFTLLSRLLALSVEAFLVDSNYVKNPNTYNIAIGGRGGWHIPDREACNAKISLKLKGNKNGIGNKGMLGRKATELTKKKMSLAQKGNKNSLGKLRGRLRPNLDRSFMQTLLYKEKQRQNSIKQWEKQKLNKKEKGTITS